MTLRYARLLVRPLSRSINWVPLAPASALGLLFVWLTARDAHAGLDEMIVALRGVAILLALATAFVLDDVAGGLAASAPLPLLVRSTIRSTVAAVPVTLVWFGTVVVAAGARPPGSPGLPVARLTLELATIMMLGGCLAATVIRRNGAASGGRTAAGGLLALTVLTWLVPDGLRPWVYPGQPTWQPAQRAWAVALVTTLVWFACIERVNR